MENGKWKMENGRTMESWSDGGMEEEARKSEVRNRGLVIKIIFMGLNLFLFVKSVQSVF